MRKYLLTFLAVFALLCCAAVPAFAAEEGETLSEVWTEVEGSTYIGEPPTASGGSGTVVRPVESADPSYFVLRYAADQLDFTYGNLTQNSCRVFTKTKDGIFVTFFDNDEAFGYYSIQAVGGCRHKIYIYSDGSFIPFSENENGITFYLKDLLYSEYSLSFPAAQDERRGVSISDNTSSLHYTLQNLVFSRDLRGIWQTIKPLIPIVAVSVVGFLAFRKGWSFLKGEAASA